ncbi:serine protease [Streptomyces luomodiensis]|uniref:Serine protease n=1 Tax=Streptomyces luomodiensis TaxID=3026192 RepID=A0ABY9USK7_9ACTN|nr:serine protease [Streptomyces sp. SCA4-21]WNE95509.1 serine protease [Streptomyces sp. SCA4-21]
MLEQPGLDALARAATVTLQADDGRPLGSGFFVAPRTVLTAAHVLRTGTEVTDCLFAIRGDLFNGGTPVQARLKQSLLTEVDPEAEYAPIDQDLALVEVLDESVEHECVWLTDSASWYGRYVAGYSYHSRGNREPHRPWQARLEVNARDGWHGIIFASSPLIPAGSSGGPVVDTVTGGVVGMLKGRIGNSGGGLGVAIALLRRFGPAYQSLMTAHDRWHGTRPLSGSVRNWIDEQQYIASTILGGAVGGDQWMPHDRRTALHLLADLPQPSDPATVVSLARKAAAGWEWADVTPDLLCWRDGHGLLYEGAKPRDAATFLRYLRLVADHVGGGGGSAGQIMSWVDDRIQALDVRGRPRAQATTQSRHPCPCRKPHPCRSSSMPVLVEDAAEAIVSTYVEVG